MKKIFLFFVLFVLMVPQVSYAETYKENIIDASYNISRDVAFIEIQSGTNGKVKYIMDQDQIQKIKNAFETLKYTESSEEEKISGGIGGFRYVVTFYCDDGTGYRFNKVKNFITVGPFSDERLVVKLDDESDLKLQNMLDSTYESIEDEYEVRLSYNQVMNKQINVIPTIHQLKLYNENGEKIFSEFPAYLYDDHNYIKLRDISEILGYEVVWNKRTGPVLYKDEESKVVGDFSKAGLPEYACVSSETITTMNNNKEQKVYYAMGCINVDGYNYFKLRDLQTVMGFSCEWDMESKSIIINAN